MQPPSADEAEMLPEGSSLVSFLQPAAQPEVVEVLARRGGHGVQPRPAPEDQPGAVDGCPVVASHGLGIPSSARRGRAPPEVLSDVHDGGGDGPARRRCSCSVRASPGCRRSPRHGRLGAQVRAYDVRAAAKEEVMSLGATFVELGLEAQEGSGGYAREQSEEFLARNAS